MKKFSFTTEHISTLCLSLAHLFHAGISGADALFLLYEDEETPACKQILRNMARHADEGHSLAACFQAAGVFPHYLCTLLSVGEGVGKTEQTLTRLGTYYQSMARLQRQLRSALLYPAVLLGVLMSVLVVLLVWVLPVFDGVYAQLGGGLTGIAGWLLALGKAIGALLPWICAILVVTFCLFAIPPLRKGLLQFCKKHWGDKGVWAAVNTARFIQALSLGITSGMTATEAAAMASSMATTDVPAFQARCRTCQEGLEQNMTLTAALRQAELLPPAEARLLDAGTRSGQGEQALENIADRLTEHSEDRISGLAEKIEPTVVIFACLLIGLVLLSVMLPLMNIMNTIG